MKKKNSCNNLSIQALCFHIYDKYVHQKPIKCPSYLSNLSSWCNLCKYMVSNFMQITQLNSSALFDLITLQMSFSSRRLILADVIFWAGLKDDVTKYKPPCFSFHFGNLVFDCFWLFLATKLPKYSNSLFTFLLSKARQVRRKFKIKKIMQPKWRKNQKRSYQNL